MSSLPENPFRPAPLPLCAHCGLPVRGRKLLLGEPLYCCGGCALAHRLSGGTAGHGQATGLLMSIGVGCFLAMNVMMASFVLYTGTAEADRAAGEAWVRWALLALATPALFLLGAPFLARGFRRVRDRVLDTDALIVIGVGAAYILSVRSVLSGTGPLYLDTAMGILLFVTIGRYLEASSRARATDALAALISQMPSEACRVVGGVEERIPVEQLRAGDLLRIRPGERVPADGVIVEGTASVSEAEITGEPAPVPKGPGATISAGTLNLDGGLLIQARRTGSETTVARIVRLVEEARAGRYPFALLVDRISALFVPTVLSIAVITFLWWTRRAGVGEGILNSLSVLLIACPCAIGIAVPLASTAAGGRAATAGVLVRSAEVFERLASAKRIFFDKTGTLTRGVLELAAVRPSAGTSEDRLLFLAASLEVSSEHPVGVALRRVAAERSLALAPVSGFRAVPGQGVEGTIQNVDGELFVRIGTPAFSGGADTNAKTNGDSGPGETVVHVTANGLFAGSLAFRDEIRPSAAAAVASLEALGLKAEVLSGDRAGAVASFSGTLGGLKATAELSPEQKLQRIGLSISAGENPVMVGDGINDAPALSGAGVGVTLESGTDLAREAADVTILGGDLVKLPWLIGLARKTLSVARLNLFWAFFYNCIGLALAVAGLLHPLFGAVSMMLSSLLVAIHSQRLARYPLPARNA